LGLVHCATEYFAQDEMKKEQLGEHISRGNPNQPAMQTDEMDASHRAALEGIGQGVWEINHASGERYFSETWFRMRGLQSGDSSSLPFQDFITNVHPEDQSAMQESIRIQHEFGLDDLTYEYRQRHTDGRWIWILSRSRIVERDASGNSLRTIGTDTDITNIKSADEKTRRISNWMGQALASASIGVWTFNINTKELYWDKRLRDFYGVDETTEITTEMWESALHPDDRARASSTADTSIKNQGTCWNDFRVNRPDGTTIHIRRRASYYYDPEEGPLLVGVNWDVTDEYFRAAELERAKSEAESARAAMEYNALHDALTGLNNRRSLDLALEDLKKQKQDQRAALLLIDLDRFKQINDSLGHAAGDALLNHVAKILIAETDGNSFTARTGGDEFVVLLREAPHESDIVSLAERILSRVSEPFHYKANDCRFGASIGIAFSGKGEYNGRQLIANADFALYRAKNEARNVFRVFNSEMSAAVLRNKRLTDEILVGLDRNEFVPYYQLQFDAKTYEVCGAEALIRWQHPERGLLNPADFLQLAEDAGVLGKLDETILAQSLADLANWNLHGANMGRLSVNVSAKRMRDQQLIDKLGKMNIPKNAVSFEITESTLLDSHDESIGATIAQLRALGIGIEIDNFGTDQASIAGLLKLKPDRFKIDRDLVKPILTSAEQQRLLRSIIGIGKALGITVVAEGVETMEHAQALAKIDCEILQGYAFGRPMPASEVASFTEKKSWRRVA
jgi:diguanylate cyclase (GGDEF)-like protein/PAS domain S-box-containing protein